MNKLKVFLSDFQYLTRQGFVRMLEKSNEFDLVGVSEGPEGILETVLEKHPDVLLLDYQSQDPVLISLLKKILQAKATNVLVVTNDDNPDQIQNLLTMGIRGIVTKSCSQREIENAIHSVAKSNRFFCNRILDIVIAESNKEEENCEPTDLSPREYEVLKLITKGFKTVEIADKLYVSVHTINSHRKNILRKLNLKSPAELIVYAMESGLVKI